MNSYGSQSSSSLSFTKALLWTVFSYFKTSDVLINLSQLQSSTLLEMTSHTAMWVNVEEELTYKVKTYVTRMLQYILLKLDHRLTVFKKEKKVWVKISLLSLWQIVVFCSGSLLLPWAHCGSGGLLCQRGTVLRNQVSNAGCTGLFFYPVSLITKRLLFSLIWTNLIKPMVIWDHVQSKERINPWTTISSIMKIIKTACISVSENL